MSRCFCKGYQNSVTSLKKKRGKHFQRQSTANKLIIRGINQSAILVNGVNMHCKATVKFRKSAPGLIFFQRPFLRGLFLEGLIFGGAYLRREICVYKSIGLAL